MSNITGGLLDTDINKIIKTINPVKNNMKYSMILHTPERDINIQLMTSIEVLRDYNEYVSDYVLASFTMYGGDFIKDVVPYKDNLELTIGVDLEDGYESTRYKFILSNNNENINTGMYLKFTYEQLNKTEQFKVSGQCLLREVEVMRSVFISGTYSNVTVDKLLKTELYNRISATKITGTEIKPAIDIAKPDNTTTFGHIVVPTGTKLFNLANFLQDGTYGIYSGGANTYFQYYNRKPTIFVYPLYDNERFNNSEKKLMVYNSNTNKLAYIDNTYMVDGDIVKIIANGDVTVIDNGENDLISDGGSFTANDPYSMNKRSSVVSDDKMLVDHNKQIQTNNAKERRDGVNKTRYVSGESNKFKQATVVNKSLQAIYQIKWRYSNIDLIFPGMPTCYLYEDVEKGIVRLNGTVISTYERYDHPNKTKSAIINIMVEKPLVFNK